MAEDTPTTCLPAAEAGEPPVERAPAAESKPATTESAPAPVPPTTTEQPAEKESGPEEKPFEPVSAPEEKKEAAEPQAEAPAAPTEPSEAKEPEAPGAHAAPEAPSAAPAEPEPAPEANGVSDSTDKSKGKKRKSSGGIPEHKSKATKKKTQARPTNLYAKPGEYYLARLRSFPPWPSIICDESILPQSILDSRPVSAMRPDGTYREDHADGGKRAHERTFPVMFFGTNEFAWIPNMDLKPITAEECKDVPAKGKGKALLNAYAVAAEGHDLEHFKTILADHELAVQQEIEAREAKEAAKAEKQAKKNKRKSMEVVEDEDVDMDDVEEEEAAKKPKSSKKRKKSVDADAETSKPTKTPKTATKLKLTSPKTPTSETETKPAGKSKRAAATKKGAKPAVSDEEETGPETKEPEKPVDHSEIKAKREKEILYIRHKLQKGFISRDSLPKEEEMAGMVSFFNKLETYSDLEVSIIRKTKIHKVLRMIIKLNSIPREEEFHFRQRAMDILSNWKNVLDSEPAGADDKDEPKPKANGLHKEGSAESQTKPEAEKETEAKSGKEETLESTDEPMPDADTAEKAQAPEPAKESDKAAAKEGEAAQEKATEEKPAEEKAAEKTAEEQPAEKAEEKPADKPEEKAEEKAEEKPVEAAA